MKVRKIGEEYYVCTNTKLRKIPEKDKKLKSKWLIKYTPMNLGSIYFPEELQGKIIRFKIEILPDLPDIKEEIKEEIYSKEDICIFCNRKVVSYNAQSKKEKGENL